MSESVINGLFALAGIFIGAVVSWLINIRKSNLEIKILKLQIEELELNINTQKQEILSVKQNSSHENEPQKYLQTLLGDLNVWKNGLGLGRHVLMEDIYIWVNLENDGEQRGKIHSDNELFKGLINNDNAKNVLVVGGPGSGKSTLVRRWAHTLAEGYLNGKSDFLPIFISLHQLGQLYTKPDTCWKIEETTVKMLYGEQSDTQLVLISKLQEALMNGKAVIILDAADELPEASRPFLANWINTLSINNPNCLMILTSRPCIYIDEFYNFEKFNMLKFNNEQIEGFVDRWFMTLGHNIEEKKRIAKLVLDSPLVLKSNPLFLTLLCIVTEKGNVNNIPSVGALFELFVRELLEHRARRRNLLIDTKTKIKVLEEVASLLFENENKTIQEEKLLEFVEKIIPLNNIPSKLVIDEIVETSGILQYNRIGYYGFYHPLFLEFFVAKKLKNVLSEDECAQWLGKYSFIERYDNVYAFLIEL